MSSSFAYEALNSRRRFFELTCWRLRLGRDQDLLTELGIEATEVRKFIHKPCGDDLQSTFLGQFVLEYVLAVLILVTVHILLNVARSVLLVALVSGQLCFVLELQAGQHLFVVLLDIFYDRL